jgi:predicted HAD superfamily Cof-like phosphohydrolase
MTFAHQVIDFNQQVLKIHPRIQCPLSFPEFEITVKCLREEVDEFIEASQAADYIGQIDALIDLQYFAMGALYKLGMTADQINRCCTAVHEANMEKKLGVKASRGDGSAADAIKPEGWVPPEHRIGEILES